MALPSPAGARYAVIYDDHDAIAWCPTEAVMVEALRRNWPWFLSRVRVMRLPEKIVIWPWFTKGGRA